MQDESASNVGFALRYSDSMPNRRGVTPVTPTADQKRALQDNLIGRFGNRQGYRPILDELFRRSIKAEPPASEVDLAEALGKKEALSDSDLASARGKVFQIRRTLEQHYDSDAKRDPIRVQISKGGPGTGGYTLVYLVNVPPRSDPRKDLWSPYLRSPY